MTKKKSLIQQIGIPRLIIGIFLLMLFIAAPMAGVSLTQSKTYFQDLECSPF